MTSTNSTSEPPDSGNQGDPSASAGVKLADQRGAWSSQIEERFAITLPDGLRAWWDQDLWRFVGPGEYRYAVSPEILLSDHPDPLWPPLMPPNFLPLVGNGAGDWLCLRLRDPQHVGPGDLPFDVCQWYHGGGDWLPWGDSLAEALLFGLLLPYLPAPDTRHAVPAEDQTQTPYQQSHSADQHPWCRWIVASIPACQSSALLMSAIHQQAEDASSETIDPRELAEVLLANDISQAAVRCQLILSALDVPAAQQVSPKLANQLSITWNDWMRWCFDLETLPAEIKQRLVDHIGITAEEWDASQQDWTEVAQHASWVSQHQPDLAWGHDLAGYALLRQGRHHEATEFFRKSLRCSVFTDQSVRFRTHWATSRGGVAKFALNGLKQAGCDLLSAAELESSRTSNAIECLGIVPIDLLSSRLHTLLSGSSEQPDINDQTQPIVSLRAKYAEACLQWACQSSLDDRLRVRGLYAGGWDLGAEPMSVYAPLLDQYVIACRAADWAAHEQLAQIHRACLRHRYNM